jgi:hypothetical protein
MYSEAAYRASISSPKLILTNMSQQPNDGNLSQYSGDMTAYTLEQLVQWRASLERKAKEQEEKARAGW